MPQQKSTSFLAAKVANFGVVMAEMVVEMGDLRREVKRLRHHVSVVSKRNHRMVKDGTRQVTSSIASDTSMTSDYVEVVWEEEEGVEIRDKVVATEVGAVARRKTHGNRVPDPWYKKGVEEFSLECQARGRYLGRTKWKVAELEVAKEVVAESVAEAEVEEVEVPKPVVRMPRVEIEEEGGQKRRIGEMTEDEEEVDAVRG